MQIGNTCCCGCTLRIGTLIIGSISLVCSAASLIFMIANIPMMMHYSANHGVIKKSSPKSDVEFINGSNIDEETSHTPDDNDLHEKNSSLYELIDQQLIFNGRPDKHIIMPYLAGDTISLVSSILLIVGALKRNQWLLLPWIGYTSLSVLIGIVASIYNQIILSRYVSGATISLAVLCIFLGLGLYLYMLSVVIRHFVELRKTDKERVYDPGKIYAPPKTCAPYNVSVISCPPEKEGS